MTKCTCESIRELDDRDPCPLHDIEYPDYFSWSAEMANNCGYCGQPGHDRLGCPNRDPSTFLTGGR